MIRVTLIIDLPEWWGAEQSFAAGGAEQVKELCKEDLGALIEDAQWKVERINQ